MLCGLVPVTTDSHGENEYIENGVNGFYNSLGQRVSCCEIRNRITNFS